MGIGKTEKFGDFSNTGMITASEKLRDIDEARRVESAREAAAEMVNHPKHYNAGKHEAIDVIEDWKLGFCDGNAVKYIARAKHKGSEVEDIKKSIWYLQRHLKNLQEKANASR